MLVIQAAASPMSYRRKHARDTGYRGVLSVRCHYDQSMGVRCHYVMSQ